MIVRREKLGVAKGTTRGGACMEAKMVSGCEMGGAGGGGREGSIRDLR